MGKSGDKKSQGRMYPQCPDTGIDPPSSATESLIVPRPVHDHARHQKSPKCDNSHNDVSVGVVDVPEVHRPWSPDRTAYSVVVEPRFFCKDVDEPDAAQFLSPKV